MKERFYWIQLYGFLAGLAVLCYIPAVVDLTPADGCIVGVVAGVLSVAVYACADGINAIHRERQLKKYRRTLDGYENNIRYLKMVLAALEKRLGGIKLARRYNMAKRDLLKNMIG